MGQRHIRNQERMCSPCIQRKGKLHKQQNQCPQLFRESMQYPYFSLFSPPQPPWCSCIIRSAYDYNQTAPYVHRSCKWACPPLLKRVLPTQAMSMGLPVISTNWSGIQAYLDESVGYPIEVSAAHLPHSYVFVCLCPSESVGHYPYKRVQSACHDDYECGAFCSLFFGHLRIQMWSFLRIVFSLVSTQAHTVWVPLPFLLAR
jgi:hypothetical protein